MKMLLNDTEKRQANLIESKYRFLLEDWCLLVRIGIGIFNVGIGRGRATGNTQPKLFGKRLFQSLQS